MENDLIIVKITQTEHRGVQEAASGDWVVASDKARYFTRLVAVGQKNIELGVFEIVGHTDIPVPSGTSNKVRFDLVPSEETLTRPSTTCTSSAASGSTRTTTSAGATRSRRHGRSRGSVRRHEARARRRSRSSWSGRSRPAPSA